MSLRALRSEVCSVSEEGGGDWCEDGEEGDGWLRLSELFLQFQISVLFG